jgi:ribosome-associated translation inhibitor RaiA
MTIQLNTDKNIAGTEKLKEYVSSVISESLARFSDHITRIEVHFKDENGGKAGQKDMRCMLEARIENKQPIAVTSHSETIEQALFDAVDKLKASIGSIHNN